MRRLNSYDSKISTVQNDNTLRGLFNAIDSYREKKADTEGAVAQIDRILGWVEKDYFTWLREDSLDSVRPRVISLHDKRADQDSIDTSHATQRPLTDRLGLISYGAI